MAAESESKGGDPDVVAERDVDFSTLSAAGGASEGADGETSSSSNDSSSNKGEVAKLRAELEAVRAEIADHKDKYLRALAELENYKKRAMKERSELIKYQGERILADLVEVLDNLGLALKYKDGEADKLRAGLEMVHKLFLDTLAKWEVRPESALGRPFDPNKFEALSKIPVDDAVPGTVINEFKVAYMYKDKLLRPGSVVVADEPVRGEAEDSKESPEVLGGELDAGAEEDDGKE